MKLFLVPLLCLSSLMYATDTYVPPDKTTTFTMLDAGDTLTVASDGTITEGTGEAVIMDAASQVVTNGGAITGSTNGILSNETSAQIINSGDITGTASLGVEIHESNAVIQNLSGGTITGTSDGIKIKSDAAGAQVTNSGQINGDVLDGVEVDGSKAVINNVSGGTITGNRYAIGFWSDGQITNSGTITATEYGVGLWSDAQLTNEGDISGGIAGVLGSNNAVIRNLSGGTITGDDGGVKIAISKATVVNLSGGAITGDNYGVTIDSTVTGAQVTNSGLITGDDEDGIEINGNNAVIRNLSGGSITGDDNGIDIDSGADDAKVTNSGTITGTTLDGILISGDNAVVTNSSGGTITGSDDGIEIDGDNAVVTNLSGGTITADFGINIDFASTGAQVTNSGTITGTSLAGIYTGGDNAVVTNLLGGTITGTSQDGIYISGDGAQVTNSGTIEATGATESGVRVDGDNPIVTNLSGGNITGSDDGIQIGGENAVIKNLSGGTITGSNNGIEIFGNDAQVTNSGTITGTVALSFQGSNPALVLQKGSNIQGQVDMANAVDLTVKNGLNLHLEMEDGGAGFNSITSDIPFVTGTTALGLSVGVEPETGIIATVDPTQFVMQVDLLEDLSDTVLNNLYQTENNFLTHVESYSSTYEPSLTTRMYSNATGGVSARSRRTSGVSSTNSQGGFVLANALELGNDNVIGAFFSSLWGKGSVSPDVASLNSQTYLGGVSYEQSFSNIFVAASIAPGYYQAGSSRTVMDNGAPSGFLRASSQSKGAVLLSEVYAAMELIDSWNYRPVLSASLRYCGLYLKGYTETGTNSDLSVQGNSTSLLKPQLNLSFVSSVQGDNASLNFSPYIGLAGRFQVGGRDIDATLLDQSLRFNIGGRKSIAEFLYGLSCNVSSPVSKGILVFFLNVQGLTDSANSNRFLGEAGFTLHF